MAENKENTAENKMGNLFFIMTGKKGIVQVQSLGEDGERVAIAGFLGLKESPEEKHLFIKMLSEKPEYKQYAYMMAAYSAGIAAIEWDDNYSIDALLEEIKL